MHARDRRGLHVVCSCAVLACATVVQAQSSSAPDTVRGKTVIAPTIVTATGERQRRTESSATIDAASGGEIERTRASHPSGIMNRVAGVHVSELSAEGHSMAIRQPLTTKPMYL